MVMGRRARVVLSCCRPVFRMAWACWGDRAGGTAGPIAGADPGPAAALVVGVMGRRARVAFSAARLWLMAASACCGESAGGVTAGTGAVGGASGGASGGLAGICRAAGVGASTCEAVTAAAARDALEMVIGRWFRVAFSWLRLCCSEAWAWAGESA